MESAAGIWSILTYVASGIVFMAALVRAAKIEGVQWYAYLGYTFNSVIIILYAVSTNQYNLMLNQGLLMITNCIGLIRWRGQ